MHSYNNFFKIGVCIFFICISIQGYSQSFNNNIQWESFMQAQMLKWDSISDNYYTGILLGNGQLGTNIYKENNQAIRFDIGRSDVTDQRPHNSDTVAFEQLLSRPRLPIGKMLLNTNGAILSADMQLDIYNAESTGTIKTTKGTIHFFAYVPTGQDVIVVKVYGTADEKNIQWQWVGEESISPRITSQSKKNGITDYQYNPSFIEKDSAGYHICHQPLLYSNGYSTVYKVKQIIDTSVLLIAVGNEVAINKSATAEAIQFINNYIKKGESAVLQNHRNWWHNFTKQSFISIPDARMQGYYWMEQYNMASATRAGKPMVDLMGPWYKSKTPWPAIWWNLNTQLAYSSVFASNHLELGRSLFDAFYNNQNTLIKNAPAKWQYDAAAVNRISSYDLHSPVLNEEIENGKFEPGNLTWALFYYHKYFLYSKDTNELQTRIFPLLKRSVNFLIHLLNKDDQGIYHLVNSFSPEYSDAVDAHYSLSALKWGLKTLINTDRLLKSNDADRKKWEEILIHLPPYYTNEKGYLIGKDKELLTGHRHFSHLMMIYPYREVSLTDSASLAIANKSTNYWISMNKKFRGYSYVAASSMASLLNKGNLAYNFLDTFLLKHAEVNGLYAEAGPCFETPHGMTNSLLEMLLQSQEPIIQVFPAIPDAWEEASFENLRAEGAFLVSAARKSSKTAVVIVKSEKGGITTIVTTIPAIALNIASNMGKSIYQLKEEQNKSYITLNTKVGEVITISHKNFPSAAITPVKSTSFDTQWWGLQKNHKESILKKNRN
ncbi:MAG: hypothetical protein RLZ50_24 [Bacteroidota bacterium]